MSTLGPEEMEELDTADRALAASMKRQGRSFVDAASEPAHAVRTENGWMSVTLFGPCVWCLSLGVTALVSSSSTVESGACFYVWLTGAAGLIHRSVVVLMQCCPL